MTAAIPLNQISTQPIERLSTGYEGLDWVYGSSRQADGTWAWGLPIGAVSLWAGAAGSGKSRLAIALASAISRRGDRVLYLQNEVSNQQFKNWVDGQQPDASNFFLGNNDTIDDIIQASQQVQPVLLVIDSVSMLDGIERPSKAKQAILQLKRLAERMSCHIILVGHLNSKGQVKGGSTMTHLVDTVCRLEKCPINGWLWIDIPTKHRYGETGRAAAFCHDNDGIRYLCIEDPMLGWSEVILDPRTGRERSLAVGRRRSIVGRLRRMFV